MGPFWFLLFDPLGLSPVVPAALLSGRLVAQEYYQPGLRRIEAAAAGAVAIETYSPGCRRQEVR